MRIAMVASRYPFGGAEQVAMLLTEGLEKKHDVFFITTGDEEKFCDEGGHKRIVIPLPRLKMFWHHYWNRSVVRALKAQLEQIHPDVVHFHSISSRTFSASALLVSKDYPTVWSLHDVWSQCIWSVAKPPACPGMFRRCRWCGALPVLSRVNRVLKERVYRRADIDVIVPCRWLQERISSSALGRKRVHIIANGTPVERFQAGDGTKVRSRLGIATTDRVVLFAGQMMNDWKGHKDLLRVAERMLRERSDLWFILVGRFKEKPLEHDRVIFPGSAPYEEMPDYYAAGDVFAYPTHADIQPQVVAEAMASGLPVVAYRVGGVGEMAIDGESGFVVAEGDETAFEDRLRQLIDDPAQAKAMGAAARERVKNNFSIELQVRRTEEVYRRLAAERKAAK